MNAILDPRKNLKRKDECNGYIVQYFEVLFMFLTSEQDYSHSQPTSYYLMFVDLLIQLNVYLHRITRLLYHLNSYLDFDEIN